VHATRLADGLTDSRRPDDPRRPTLLIIMPGTSTAGTAVVRAEAEPEHVRHRARTRVILAGCKVPGPDAAFLN
jgi:hypothetical protein